MLKRHISRNQHIYLGLRTTVSCRCSLEPIYGYSIRRAWFILISGQWIIIIWPDLSVLLTSNHGVSVWSINVTSDYRLQSSYWSYEVLLFLSIIDCYISPRSMSDQSQVVSSIIHQLNSELITIPKCQIDSIKRQYQLKQRCITISSSSPFTTVMD